MRFRRHPALRLPFVLVPALIFGFLLLMFLTPIGSALVQTLFPSVPTSPVQPTQAPTTKPTDPGVASMTPIPTGQYPSSLKVWSASADFRSVSDPQASPTSTLGYLTVVTYVSGPDGNNYLQVRTADGRVGYIATDRLVDASLYLYANIPVVTLSSSVPGSKDAPKASTLVDVRRYAPGISVDMVFAQTKNLTGRILYKRDLCLLQQGTLDKLRNAQAMFQKSGYSIKIYDAYRPYSVTVELATSTGAAGYKSDVKSGTFHNRGSAVDMTIVDKHGNEIEMPSKIYSLSSDASRGSPMSTQVRRNLDYVESIMVACGFSPYSLDWWQYNDSESYKYPYMDLDFATMDIIAVLDAPLTSPPPLVDEGSGHYFSVTPAA